MAILASPPAHGGLRPVVACGDENIPCHLGSGAIKHQMGIALSLRIVGSGEGTRSPSRGYKHPLLRLDVAPAALSIRSGAHIRATPMRRSPAAVAREAEHGHDQRRNMSLLLPGAPGHRAQGLALESLVSKKPHRGFSHRASARTASVLCLGTPADPLESRPGTPR